LKKQKEEEDFEIKWPFWEDLNFLRASLQNSDEDNLAWKAEYRNYEIDRTLKRSANYGARTFLLVIALNFNFGSSSVR